MPVDPPAATVDATTISQEGQLIIHKLLMPAMALFVLTASMEAKAQDSFQYVQADQTTSAGHTPLAGSETNQSPPSETVNSSRESALDREMNRFSESESEAASTQADKAASSNSTTSMVVGGFILSLIVMLIIAIGATKGCRQVNWALAKQPLPCALSDGSGRPSSICIGTKATKRGPADQMALDVEGIVDRCVGCEKSLR